MAHKKNRGKHSKAEAPHSQAPVATKKAYISLRCLAEIYGLDMATLSFAVAEISDGEDSFDLLPAVLIANSHEYIDLAHGIKVSMSHAAARTGRHNFFAATVKYDNGEFVFMSQQTQARVSKATLAKHYGTAIVP